MSKIRVTYKTIRAIKTSSDVTLTKEVVSIDYGNRTYPTSGCLNRRIFIDEKNHFWYLIGGHVFPEKYAFAQIAGGHYQAITIAGTKLVFQVHGKFELVEQISYGKPDVNALSFVLSVGHHYRLNNGLKMKIVAVESDTDFVSELTYIGVYRQNKTVSAIRFNVHGKVISHGGNIEYDIDCEWTAKDLWVVTGPNPNTYPVTYWSVPFDTEEAAKTIVGTNKSLVITKVTV